MLVRRLWLVTAVAVGTLVVSSEAAAAKKKAKDDADEEPQGEEEKPRAPRAAPSVHAGDALSLGAKGSFILSAERMFGASWNQIEMSGDGGTSTVAVTSYGLLWNQDRGTSFQTPRVAFDYAVMDGLTLGAAVGYSAASLSVEATPTGQPTTKTDGDANSTLLFAPRVGYVLSFSPSVGLWLRGGITYTTRSSDPRAATDNTITTLSGTAVTLEPQFVISPLPHFALTVGLAADIGVSGTYKSELNNTSSSTDVKSTHVGLVTGLIGWF